MNEFVALRRRAAAAGLSLTELCRRVPVSRATYFRWERKGARPLHEHVLRLVAVVEAAENAHGTLRDASAKRVADAPVGGSL